MKKQTIDVTMRLPQTTVAAIEKVARLAGVKPEVVIKVMMATYLVHTEEKAK